MKNINSSILIIILFFCSCQKNEDILTTDVITAGSTAVTTVDLTLSGYVMEPYSSFQWTHNILRMHDVEIKLMYQGEVLDQTNTNAKGRYEFPEQSVPVEGAYLLFNSPGYFPNVSKVDTIPSSFYTTYMLRETHPFVSSSAITNGENFIKISGKLQEPTQGGGGRFFILNSEEELIGNYTSDANLDFEFTTVANEELFFYYGFRCPEPELISLGSFSESTDVGVLLDESYDFAFPYVEGTITADNCSGGQLSSGYVFITSDNYTIHNQGNGYYSHYECLLEQDPNAFLTYVNDSPRMYGDVPFNYTGGQAINLDVSTCNVDDTNLSFTIGSNPEIVTDLYTFANIEPNGRLLLKQVDPYFSNTLHIAFDINDALPGNTTGDLRFYTFGEIILGGNELEIDITLNDGNFVEGTFTGEVNNPLEISLGLLEGSFRARIH